MNISVLQWDMLKPSPRTNWRKLRCFFGDTLLGSHMTVSYGDILGLWPNRFRMHFCARIQLRVFSFMPYQLQARASGVAGVRLPFNLNFMAYPAFFWPMPVAQQRFPSQIQTRIAREWIEMNLRSSLYNVDLLSRHFRHFRALATLPKFKRPKPELIGGMS